MIKISSIIIIRLTNPATISPPIVPWELIDAIATLVANDQSSALGATKPVVETNFEESILSAGDTRDWGI